MRLVRSEIDPMHNAGDNAGRKPNCAVDIARASEFVGWLLASGDLGDDTLDHRAGEGPGRCRLPPIGCSPRAAPGPRRSNVRSRGRACTATPPLVLLRGAGTRNQEVWMPRLHCRDCMIDKGRAPPPMSSRYAAIWRPVPCCRSMNSRPPRSQTCDQRMTVRSIVSE